MKKIIKFYRREKNKTHFKTLWCIFLIFLIVFLINISLISAWEWDNVKSYDESKKEITIINALGLGEDLLKAQLIKNTYFCSENCEAIIKVTNFKEQKIYDSIKFNKLLGNKWNSKNLDYEIYLGNEEISYENVYNNKTKQLESINKTSINYKPFEDSKIPVGEYYIKIKGQKEKNEIIDWIINLLGQDLNEWAFWNPYDYLNDEFDDAVLNTTLWSNSSGISNGNNYMYEHVDGYYYINEYIAGEGGGYAVLETLTDFKDGIDYLFNFSISGDVDCGTHSTNSEYLVMICNQTSDYIGHFNNQDECTRLIDVDDEGTTFGIQGFSLLINGTSNSTTLYNGDGSVNLTTSNISNYEAFYILFGVDNTVGTWQNVTLKIYNFSASRHFDVPSITLNSPINYFNSSTPNITFECSSNGNNLVNLSLLINDIINYTVSNTTENQVNLSLSYTPNITDGENQNWSCISSDLDGNLGTSETRYFTIDTTFPDIFINLPSTTENYGYLNKQEELNWSSNELSLDSVWYNYNGTNVIVYGASNNTNFTIQYKTGNNLTIYLNDTSGNTNSTNVSWDYKIFENNQSFNNQTTEGATEKFSINLTKSSDIQISTIYLIHNGTFYSFPYSINGNNIIAENSITIPSKNSSSNETFFWNINLDDGSSINTTSNKQEIFILNIDDCTAYTNLIYNFTHYDEENKSILYDGTIELKVEIYDIKKELKLLNFSDKYFNHTSVSLCLETPLLNTTTYSSYITIKYYKNSTVSNNTYSTEYYNILNQTLTNATSPRNIKLYNLNEGKTTKFRLTFRDNTYSLVPNILVNVYRQYIEDGDFKIVEIPLTDSNGQTILNLVKNDIVYNLVMTNEAGEIIATFNSISAFCQDFTIGECTINLNAEPSGSGIYDYDKHFGVSVSSLSYNNVTDMISLDFVTNDLQPKNLRMEVVRNNEFGNRSVCSNSLTSASGTLNCNVSSVRDTDQYLFTTLYVDNELFKTTSINLNTQALGWGIVNGAFYAFLLILILMCLFMNDKKILMISLGLGWIAIISMNLVNGSLFNIASGGIWLLITIAIFIWKLNQE